MAPHASIPRLAANPERRRERLAQMRGRYHYRKQSENQLWPMAIARAWGWGWPFFKEFYDLRWIWSMAKGWVGAWLRRALLLLRFAVQKLTFRFDKLRAYDLVFPGQAPPFGGLSDSDEAFAYWRIAGPNPVSLRQESDLAELRRRIPFDTARIEARLRDKLKRPVQLQAEAAAGRLFAVDFLPLQRALRPVRPRDSRWREKYLPAPVGVFLEAPGFYKGADLVPLAILIDQNHPDNAPNPVYYPGAGWGWRIAKMYFQVADTSYHAACGHVQRTHLVMEPFCLATPRCLSEEHPVFILLRPHTRFTLPSNKAAYDYFTQRSKTYYEFYAGTLEETRQIAIQSYHDDSFRELGLERELQGRSVEHAPVDYPYRDDALLWIPPIRGFVSAYIDAFYASDADVAGDGELKAWATELMDPQRGAVRDLVAGGRLDTKAKLIDVLTQVLFTAGPGHASQHFSSNHYYRYAPAFPGAAHTPPPWRADRAHRARFVNALPPLGPASNQARYNTFSNLQYDRFGHYDRFELGGLPEAEKPIEELQVALDGVERIIAQRGRNRLLPYEFLLPSNVPNSANI